jgi:hypothetical protein
MPSSGAQGSILARQHMCEVAVRRRHDPALSTLARLGRNKDLRRQQQAGRNAGKYGDEQECLRVVGGRIAGRKDRQDEDQVDAAERRHQRIGPGHQHRRADHEGRER